MMRQSALAILLAFGTAGCVSAPVLVAGKDPGHGPPPHAPAHGYRAKHGHGDMQFDTGLGVYVVVGYPGFYFLSDYYYRMIDSTWHIAVDVNGPWTVVNYGKVPPGLVKKHGRGKSKEKDHGNGKGKGNGKKNN